MFIISTCKSRKSKKYKERAVSWSDFCKELETVRRTPEAYTDYIKMSRDKQTEIKDCGGFVAGRLKDGVRKNSTFKDRCMVCLDEDYAPADPWEVLKNLPFNVCVYSTHKHSSKLGKYRILVPLSEEITDPDKYEAVARMFAKTYLNMDWLDDTSYQPVRMMFYPSASYDGEYVYHATTDKEFLNPNDILDLYESDWHDANTWPVSSRLDNAVSHDRTKMAGDPLTKPGAVGVFCRAYPISEAIDTFLSDVYEPTDQEDRYTYKAGTCTGGLVLYEDKFAYSHHGTDPANTGHLMNAYDLVCTHLYSGNEEAFNEFLQTDNKFLDSRFQDIRDDFKEDFEDVSTDWLNTLDADKKGNLLPTRRNITQILTNDPRLKGIGGVNYFTKKHIKSDRLPWDSKQSVNQRWSDTDDAGLRDYLEKHYHLDKPQKTADALALVAETNGFHPVREYLDGLSWDGTERAETLLIDYLGAKDSDYTRAVTRKTLIAMVKRIYEPGCKFDNVLVLLGEQGIGKSTLFNKLTGEEWYNGAFATFAGKEAIEGLQGKWVVELSEMCANKKSDNETIKSFISLAQDDFRPAYGKHVETRPRQNIFIGTTNDADYLKDDTGNRRFWTVECFADKRTKDIWTDLTEAEAGQILAEAKELYLKGEPVYLSRELEQVAREIQENYKFVSEEEGLIKAYLDMKIPPNFHNLSAHERQMIDTEPAPDWIPRDYVCLRELWTEALGLSKQSFKLADQRRLGKIVRKLGWEKGKTARKDKVNGPQNYFIRKGD